MKRQEEKTSTQKLEEARNDIRKLAAAAAAAAAAASNDPLAFKDLPMAYRTIANALQSKIAAMCLAAAEVEAVISQLTYAWADCLEAQQGGF